MSRSRPVRSAILASVLSLGTLAAQSASPSLADPNRVIKTEDWDIESRVKFSFLLDDHDQCFLGTAYGVADVHGSTDGYKMQGLLATQSGCDFEDVRAQDADTGLFSEAYQYIGDDKGEAIVNAYVRVSGRVVLADADVACAALGYVEFQSSITETVRALLTESAGETTSEGLGSLEGAFAGLDITVTPSISLGTGTYADGDTDHVYKRECTDFLFYKKRARGYLEAWSHAWITSEGFGRMSGSSPSIVRLGECSS